MDKAKAGKIRTVLTGAGIIFLLIPLFGGEQNMQQAFMLLGVLCLLGAVGAGQFTERKKRSHEEDGKTRENEDNSDTRAVQ